MIGEETVLEELYMNDVLHEGVLRDTTLTVLAADYPAIDAFGDVIGSAENAGATIHCFDEVPFEEAYISTAPELEEHNWGDSLRVAAILDEVNVE